MKLQNFYNDHAHYKLHLTRTYIEPEERNVRQKNRLILR